MAMYRCSECDELVDDDYNPGVESPTEEFGLMCESCACEIDEVEVKVKCKMIDDKINSLLAIESD